MDIIIEGLAFIGKVWLIIAIVCQLYVMKLEFDLDKNITISSCIEIIFCAFILAICWPVLLKLKLRNEVLND